MKLFKFQNTGEGGREVTNTSAGNAPQDVIIALGKKYEWCEGVLVHNGWYLKLELPIKIFRSEYLDPHTFEHRSCYCRPVCLFAVRTFKGRAHPTFYKIGWIWNPLEVR